MNKLPKSLQTNNLIGKELPGDTTIAEAIGFFMNGQFIDAFKSMSKTPERVKIRFTDQKGNDLPGSMTMKKFRQLANEGKAKLSIDDGTGGMKVSA